MTKEKLWLEYCKKNPRFLDEKAEITFTGKGLKKLFDQTYDLGFAQGKDVAANEKSIFENIFGTKG